MRASSIAVARNVESRTAAAAAGEPGQISRMSSTAQAEASKQARLSANET